MTAYAYDWQSMSRFEDDPNSDTLWVVFLPEDVNSGSLKMRDALAAMPGKKLYVSFLNRESYNSSDPETHRAGVEVPMAFIEDYRKKYNVKRTLAWGYSRGAYFAILFGSLCKYDRVLAISAELTIGRPHTRSAKLISNPYEPYADLIPHIESFRGEGMDIILPCFSPREAHNLYAASRIRNRLCDVHPFLGGHFVQRVLEKSGEINSFVHALYTGQRITLPEHWRASQAEVAVAKASFDLAANIDNKDMVVPKVDDSTSRNHEWFFLKSKALNRSKQLAKALEAAEKSVALNPNVVPHLVHLAQLYLRRKQVAKAREVCEKAMQRSGDLVTVRKTMALIEKAEGNGNLDEVAQAAEAEEARWRLKSGQED